MVMMSQEKKSSWLISGQTSVEYLMLLSVLVVILLGLSAKIKSRMVGTGSCPGPGLFCNFQEAVGGDSLVRGNFREFTPAR